jgi:hypothetical protein
MNMQKNTVEHPVAKALGSVIVDFRLSKHWLSRIIEARVCLQCPTTSSNHYLIFRYRRASA